MDGTAPLPELRLDSSALQRMMPMHLRLGPAGHVVGFGPTLEKLLPGIRLTGRHVFDLFEVRRPSDVMTIEDLKAVAGQRLYLALRDRISAGLRGIAVPLADGQGMLINLSFGIGVTEAVRTHALTDADFAPTDLTMEVLFLVEVNAAVITELRELNLRLQGAKTAAEEKALTDTLTGLRNRRGLDLALAAAMPHGQPLSLMHIDLDFFKAVNDTLGHAAGDHVLREVARVLTRETRANDTVARVGGDEFVIVFPGFADGPALTAIGERIINKLSHPMMFEGAPCRISASIGLTLSSLYQWPDCDQMLADADAALYGSKRAGRGRVTMFSPA